MERVLCVKMNREIHHNGSGPKAGQAKKNIYTFEIIR